MPDIPEGAKKPQDHAAKNEATGDLDEVTIEHEGITVTFKRSAITLRVMLLIEQEKVMTALQKMLGEDQFDLIADLPIASAESLFQKVLSEAGTPNSSASSGS